MLHLFYIKLPDIIHCEPQTARTKRLLEGLEGPLGVLEVLESSLRFLHPLAVPQQYLLRDHQENRWILDEDEDAAFLLLVDDLEFDGPASDRYERECALPLRLIADRRHLFEPQLDQLDIRRTRTCQLSSLLPACLR